MNDLVTLTITRKQAIIILKVLNGELPGSFTGADVTAFWRAKDAITRIVTDVGVSRVVRRYRKSIWREGGP